MELSGDDELHRDCSLLATSSRAKVPFAMRMECPEVTAFGDISNVYSPHQFAASVIASVNVTMKRDDSEDRPRPQGTVVASTTTSSKRPKLTAAELADRWGIGINTAK